MYAACTSVHSYERQGTGCMVTHIRHALLVDNVVLNKQPASVHDEFQIPDAWWLEASLAWAEEALPQHCASLYMCARLYVRNEKLLHQFRNTVSLLKSSS